MREGEAVKPAETCLILGAGASVPYGYPTGRDLAREIIKRGKQGDNAWARADELPTVKLRALNLATMFEASLDEHPTIDSFLAQFAGSPEHSEGRELYETGRMLIADVIRRREQPQQGVVDWYTLLFEHLERSAKSGFAWPLRIITFNYDRSLEFHLARYHAWKTGLLQQEARHWLFERVPVLHVYGDVGPLPDGQPKRDDFAPEYGVWTGSQFWKGRETTKIMRDDDTGAEAYAECQRWIGEAEYVIVLGFGYDQMNCDRVGLSKIPDQKCVLTSAYDRNEHQRIRTALSRQHSHVGLAGDDCFRFLLRTQVLTRALNGWPAADLVARLGSKGEGAGR